MSLLNNLAHRLFRLTGVRDGEQDGGKIWKCGKLSFVHKAMGFGAGIGFAFLALSFKLAAGRNDFHIQPVIADQRHDNAIRIQRVFPEHRAGGEMFRIAQFAQNEINCFLLRGHAKVDNKRRSLPHVNNLR